MKNFKNLVLLVSLISLSGIICSGCNFKMNTSKEPPQSYDQWQEKNDKNYVPKQLPNVKVNVKVKSKQVPQSYEEWEKKNR